jgi:7,8-dihydropterin-6-yl-methyl-4-(beta-D-ribofuranosyl)aminobenzene 5'-phosphate synthase
MLGRYKMEQVKVRIRLLSWMFIILVFSINSKGQPNMTTEPQLKSPLTMTVLFDNIVYDSSLLTEWGFSCVIQTEQDTLLFDSGSNGAILLENMAKLKIDPLSIQAVVISHTHWDHLGGLSDFLKINPNVKVFIPHSSSLEIENQIIAPGAKAIRVDSLLQIVAGIFSLGELQGIMPEQSLAIRTRDGLVVMTGCAHPGIVTILKHAKSLFSDDSIFLAIGGFHLKGDSPDKIAQTVTTIQQLGVSKIAPSHCTGEAAIEAFKQRFGDDFIQSGVGKSVILNLKSGKQ